MEKVNTATEYMEFEKLPSFNRRRLLEYYENRYQGDVRRGEVGEIGHDAGFS